MHTTQQYDQCTLLGHGSVVRQSYARSLDHLVVWHTDQNHTPIHTSSRIHCQIVTLAYSHTSSLALAASTLASSTDGNYTILKSAPQPAAHQSPGISLLGTPTRITCSYNNQKSHMVGPLQQPPFTAERQQFGSYTHAPNRPSRRLVTPLNHVPTYTLFEYS